MARIIIIGGVAGGMSAATRLRRLSEDAEIIVLEAGPHVSFANCGLPYYAGEVITDRDQLLLQTPDSLAARFNLDVRVHATATAIDPVAKTVTVRSQASGDNASPAAQTQDTELTYDALVLSPGASPFVPQIPGAELALTLRDVTDVDTLVEQMGQAKSAVILGGGFVGLELAENLVHRGLDVSVVELADQIMAPLDPEMAAVVTDHLRQHKVSVFTGAQAQEILPNKVVLSTGQVLAADITVAAIGVSPRGELAAAAGAAMGPRGAIKVNDRMETSLPGIYAVGDAVVKADWLTAQETLIPLANIANRQGRLVADVIAQDLGLTQDAGSQEFQAGEASIGTAVVGLFGMTAATTGWNEKRLRTQGRQYRAIHTHPLNHAGYYPGAQPMSLKLLVDPETDLILGAQGVGGDGVEKRIDVLATAIAGGITASRLANLELSYAPQFGSAKDPVNMLGYVADNLRTGATKAIQWHELEARIQAGAVLVDVRTAAEHGAGSIPGAINVPLDDLRERHGELAGKDIIVHCQVGQRGHTAARLLTQLGHSVVNLDGGWKTWASAHRN
ncbi:FAD-dependent oxidoreductase [Jonesiaceae bacterium BS-20]|uniref:FAD-dependent oxidoreductase n=1 Tax=Jonesiaceae bacterium BS-20 TaxID=3120821 RepID=A0AAU7E1Q6_9MICO